MRRGLAPSDLGDLFDQPRAAVISMSLPDARVFSRRDGAAVGATAVSSGDDEVPVCRVRG